MIINSINEHSAVLGTGDAKKRFVLKSFRVFKSNFKHKKKMRRREEQRNSVLSHDGIDEKVVGSSEKQENTEVSASQTVASQECWNSREEDRLENQKRRHEYSRQEV